MQIAANLYLIPGVIAHSYLLVDPDGLTLIDTGIPGSANKILRYIRRLGYSIKDLKHILLTHADYDHAGGTAALKKASGARVFASKSEARAMAAGRFPRSLTTRNFLLKPIFFMAELLGKVAPAHVDECLEDGQVLPVLGGLFVMDTRGHTPGHISFFGPSRGILFTGDSILSKNDQLVGSHGPVTWDQKKADESAYRQFALRAQIICSGHGAIIMDGLNRWRKVADCLTLAPAYQRI